MNKRFTSFLTLIFLVTTLFYSSCSNGTDATDKEVVTETTAEDGGVVRETKQNDLPQLPLTMLNGDRLMVNQLEGKTVLVLYQPECEDCQREAVQIQQQLQAFDDYALYFISNVELQEQARFAALYKLNGYHNVHFAQTSIDAILKTMGPTPAPSVFIYSDEGRLVKAFKGETPIAQILMHL